MFITFEGPEGSGKSTQIPLLADYLQHSGHRVITTREPGGTPISEQIRAIIHDLENDEMHPRTETLLYQAARAQIVEQLIRPKLEAGWIVLCDRYADSTIAYQGYGHQQHLADVRRLVAYATVGLTPNLTLLLDIDVETGLSRKTGQEWNRLDAYEVEFHQRVRNGYHQLAQEEPQRWVIVDGGQSPVRVQTQIRQIVSEYLRQ